MIDGVVDFSILVGTLLVVLAFWGLLIGGCVVFYRRLRSPLTRATFVIVPLFILDGLVAGQGILSTVTFLVGFGAQLLLAPVAFARRRSGLGRRHLGAGLFYAASILATVVWLGSNNRLARERADEIILACHR